MVDHGLVKSTIKPAPLEIDDFSVWENTDIQEISENVGTESEFVGYRYRMKQYSKDEYILEKAAENAVLSEQITDMQLALCEVYEMME